MSEQQNGFSRMNNVNHSGGSNRSTSGPARSESSAARRFSNIPLARKIEALILTAVTVIASASVDWSSLTVRAEDQYDGSLEGAVQTVDASNPTIVTELTGSSSGGDSAKYDVISSAYINVAVNGTVPFTVSVYQNYEEGSSYETAKADSRVVGGGKVTGDDLERYSAYPIFTNKPIYLAPGEKAAVVVNFNFSGVADGTTINYKCKSGDSTKAIAYSLGASATVSDVTLSGAKDKYVLWKHGKTVAFGSDFTYSPKYKREVKYHLFNGDEAGFNNAVAGGTVSYSDNGESSVASISSDDVLTSGNTSGENTLIAYSDVDTGAWIKVPVRVVESEINYRNLVYSGSAISLPTLKCGQNTLTEGTDYTAYYSGTANDGTPYSNRPYSEISKAGTYSVTITGIGNYAGLEPITSSFNIGQKSIADINTIAAANDALVVNPETYAVQDAGVMTDSAIKAADGSGTPLVLNRDFEVASVVRNDNSLTSYTITLQGINNYTGTRTVTTTRTTSGLVDISKIINSTGGLVLSDNTKTYDATGITGPSIVFNDLNGKPLGLVAGTHYSYKIINDATKVKVYDSADTTSTWTGAVDAGKYIVEIDGLAVGGYTGVLTSDTQGQYITVSPRKLTRNNIKVVVKPTKLDYTASKREPTSVEVTYLGVNRDQNIGMTKGVDYEVSYPDNAIEPGRYAVQITGLGNYESPLVDFNGSSEAPSTVTGSAFDLSENAYYYVHGSVVYYEIIPTLDSATVELGDTEDAMGYAANTSNGWVSTYSPVYDGKAKTPKVRVTIGNDTLTADTDYTVDYNTQNHTNAGDATLLIHGKGDYARYGDLTIKYTIASRKLDTNSLTIGPSVEKQVDFRRKAITLDTTDFSVAVSGIDGNRKYADVSSSDLSLSDEEIGKKYPGYDYYLTYADNRDAGEATVTAHGINNYSGTSSATFTIKPIEMTADNGFKIEPIPNQSYTGTNVEPDVTVTYNGEELTQCTSAADTAGAFIIKSYDNNIKVSSNASVTIEGRNNFSGTLTEKFTILPKSLEDGSTTYEIYGGGKSDKGVLYPTTTSAFTQEYSPNQTNPTLILYRGNHSLTSGTDYELKFTKGSGDIRNIIITGKGSYAGGDPITLTYKITAKDLSSFSKITVKPVTTSSGAITTGTDGIYRYYQILADGLPLSPAAVAVAADGTKTTSSNDFTFKWTTPQGVTLGAGVTPSVAGENYVLEITGKGNYKGTVKLTQDTENRSLMVGASLDVEDIIKVYGADTSGDPRNVPYLGNNMPAVDISGSGSRTSLADNNLNKYVDGAVALGTLSGPSYTNGFYDNANAANYTVHFVDSTGQTEYPSTTALAPGTVFRVKIEAKDGSTKYFGSHMTRVSFKMAATSLTDLKASSKANAQITVEDTANASAGKYVVSGTSITGKLSFEYTGANITPNLSVVIEPSYTGFNGSFNSIDLANYGKTQTPTSISGSAVATGNITVSANTSYFTESFDVPYAITAYTLQPGDISIDKLNLTYDGTSHDDVINKDAVHVTVKGQTVDPSKYTVKFYTNSGCSIEATAANKGYINAGNIYVQISGLADSSIEFPSGSTAVTANDHFTIAPRNLSNVIFTPVSTSGTDTIAKTEGVYAVPYSSTLLASNISATASDSVTITADDYTITPPTTLVLGANTISIEGKGNYTGSQLVNFYIYGQLSGSTTVTNRFTTSDITSTDGNPETFVLNDNGEPVNNGVVLDVRGVTFNSPDGKVSLSSSDLNVTITDYDKNIATDLSTPGKKRITFKGKGVTQKCDTASSQTFIIIVQGDLQNITVKGLQSNYDFAGNTQGNGVKPDLGKLKIQLNGKDVPSDAYTLNIASNAGAVITEFVPVSGTTQDAYVQVVSTGNNAYYTDSNSSQPHTEYFNIRYNLKDAVITSSQTDAFTMDQEMDTIKSNIIVTLHNKQLTVDDDYTLDASWTSSGNNNDRSKATLNVTVSADKAGEISYNSKTQTFTGNKKKIDSTKVQWPSTTSVEYDANDHRSDFGAVTIDGLTEGTDFTIDWVKVDENGGETTLSSSAAIKDAGSYKAYINGIGDYYTDASRPSQTFTITKRPISATNTTMALVDENVKYYSGSDPAAEYTVTDNTLGVLIKNTDYTIERTAPGSSENAWAVNTNVTYTVTGSGNFEGSISDTFSITQARLDVEGVVTVSNDSVEYDGQPHGPEFQVYRGKTLLVEGTDYDLDKKDTSVKVGKYTYVVTGKNNYTGSKPIDFSITARDLSNAKIVLTKDGAEETKFGWTGSQVKPDYKVTDEVSGSAIITTDDYDVTYSHNTDSYKYVDDDTTDTSAPTVTFTGKGNYTGTVTRHFQIGSDIADAEVALEDPTSREYSSTTPFRPNVKSITFDGTTYTSTSSPKLSEVATWSYEKADDDKTPITSSTEPKDAGNYIVKVTGKGPFFGTNEKATYTITANEADRQEIKVEIVRDASSGQMKDGDDYYYYYTGKAIEPEVKVTYTPDGSNRSVTLHESTTEDHTDGDYYVTYDDNIDVGTATINVILVNNYSGDTKHQWFEIRGVDISKYKVRAKKSSVAYTGYALEPGYILTTTKGDTYDSEEDAQALENLGITAEYTNNIAPGTGNIIVSGSKNSAGTTATATFNISADLSTDVTSITPEKVFRTGSALSPAVTLHFTDKYGNDHPVASTSNWFRTTYTPDTGNWATATKIKVAIKPAPAGYDYLEGRYTGTIELTTVPPNLTIDGYQPTYQYTGTKINPTGLTVKSDGEALPSGATVSFSFNSSRDGSACVLPGKVTITATVTYGGESVSTTAGKYSTEDNEKPATFTIVPRPIKACVFQGPSDARYTGSAVSPIFSINTGYAQLRNGTDYTYTVRNNVKPGNAIVTITGRGNYIGTTTKAFHIYVAPVTGLSSTNKSGTTATIRWRRSGTADGYRVTYTSSTGVRKMLITSGTANNYKLTDLRSGSTQVLVEAYVAGASGRPIAYSVPESVYVR